MRTRILVSVFAFMAALGGCQTPGDEPQDDPADDPAAGVSDPASDPGVDEQGQGITLINRCALIRCQQGTTCDPRTGRCEPTDPVIRTVERTATCSVTPCESCNPCDAREICTENGGNKVSCTSFVLPRPPLPGPIPGPIPGPRPVPGCKKDPQLPGQPWRDPCACMQCPSGFQCSAPADYPVCVRANWR